MGRSISLNDLQLRAFNVQEPWTRAAAHAHSPEAEAAWWDGNSSPLLDEPPAIPKGAQLALGDLIAEIPPEGSIFSFETWGNIGRLADIFISKTEDVFAAAHAYTHHWRRHRDPTTLTPQGLKLLDGIAPPELYDYVYHVAEYGVLPCGDRPPFRFPQDAYANIKDNTKATADELWGDVIKGRLMMLAIKSEPFAGNLVESKLTYVLQKDATNPAAAKVRYISDPMNEVNERLDNDRHSQRIIPRHQNVSRRAHYWKRRYPSIPVLISKRDVKGAFKLIPVGIRGLAYMGCRFSHYIGMYLALFFGWRPSPANWGLISTLLMQYVAAFRPSNDRLGGPESFIAFEYVVDGDFVEPWRGLRPWQAANL